MADSNGNGKRNGKPKWSRYDWPAIEARYVAGQMTIAALAAEIGCAETHIYRISKRDNWVEKREAYVGMVVEAAKDNKQRAVIFDKMQFDAMTERTTDLATALIAERFTAEYRAFKAGQRSEIEALEIKEMMLVVRTAQEVKYRALNIPPPKQSIAIEDNRPPAEELADMLAEAGAEYDDLVLARAVLVEPGGNGNGKHQEDDDCVD